MIEFSLSKLNMLIFVTAVAAIVIFFMAAVNSNMKTRQSYELVYKVGKELKTGIESNSYCTVKFIYIPKTIQTNSGSSDVFNIKYKLNISVYNREPKTLVFAILDRKTHKQRIYAAESIDYNGEIKLYKSNCTNTDCNIVLVEDRNSVDYDPLKASSIDTTILFAKTIDDGKPKVYLMPCLYKNGIYSCNDFLNSNNLFKIIPCLKSVPELNETTPT